MLLPETVQVLVVGAGPTGLMAAMTLAKLGVNTIVVDAGSTNPNGSRSTIIHPRSLEILDTFDLAAPILKAAVKCEQIHIRGTTNTLLSQDFSLLQRYIKFPFPALIPQEDVELFALNSLGSSGVALFRNKRVVGFDLGSKSRISVLFEDGSKIQPKYIVGADGAHSMIRSLSGIPFKDPTTGALYQDPSASIAYHLVFADVFFKDPLHPLIARNGPCAHVDVFLLMIPLRHPRAQELKASFWRIAIGFSENGPRPPKELSQDYLQGLLDERNPYDVRLVIASVTAASRYRVRAAVADTYFKNMGGSHILLAGDAAHVHSPFGGQGMNLGIGDAFSVAHAIKAHIDGEATDAILHRYAESRMAVGKEIIAMTGRLTMLVYANHGWKRITRNFLLRLVSFLPFVKRVVAWRMSGLAHRNV